MNPDPILAFGVAEDRQETEEKRLVCLQGSEGVVLLNQRDTVAKWVFGDKVSRKITHLLLRFSFLGIFAAALTTSLYFLQRADVYHPPYAVFISVASVGTLYQMGMVLVLQRDSLVVSLMTFELAFLLANIVVSCWALFSLFQWDRIACSSILFYFLACWNIIFLDAARLPNHSMYGNGLRDTSLDSISPTFSSAASSQDNFIDPKRNHYISFDVFHQVMTERRMKWSSFKHMGIVSRFKMQIKYIGKYTSWFRVILPIFLSILVNLINLVCIQLDLFKGIHDTNFSLLVFDMSILDLFRLCSLNMFVFTIRRLWNLLKDPTNVFCYRKKMTIIPMVPSWGISLAQLSQTPLEMIRSLEIHFSGALAPASNLSQGPSSSSPQPPSSPQNVPSPEIMIPGFGRDMIFSTRKTVPLDQVLGWIETQNKYMQNRKIVLNLEKVESNKFFILFSLPEDHYLLDFSFAFTKWFPNLSRRTTGFISKAFYYSGLVWVFMLPLLLLSTSIHEPLIETLTLCLSAICFVNLFLHFSLLSINTFWICMNSFENMYLLCNLVLCSLAMFDYANMSGARVYVGLPILFFGCFLVVFMDALPISFHQFDWKLCKAAQSSILKLSHFSLHQSTLILNRMRTKNSIVSDILDTILPNPVPPLPSLFPKDLDVLHSMRSLKMKQSILLWLESLYILPPLKLSRIILLIIEITSILIIFMTIKLGLMWGSRVRVFETRFGTFSNYGMLQSSLINLIVFLIRRLIMCIASPMHTVTICQNFYRVPLDGGLFKEILERQERQHNADSIP